MNISAVLRIQLFFSYKKYVFCIFPRTVFSNECENIWKMYFIIILSIESPSLTVDVFEMSRQLPENNLDGYEYHKTERLNEVFINEIFKWLGEKGKNKGKKIPTTNCQ